MPKFLFINPFDIPRMKSNINKIVKLALLKIIPAILIVYFLIFTIFSIVSLRSTLSEWNKGGENKKDTLKLSFQEWDLIHQRAFLTARLGMSASDSIGLTVNLKDSLVQLEMKGVVLRQVKFRRAELSRFFSGIKPDAYTYHFSKPFGITEIEGTIEKNPVIVRKVPKDTIEAAQTQIQIDTTKREFVEWHLMLDSSLVVSIVQSDEFDAGFDLSLMKYRLRRHMKTLAAANRNILRFRKPEYLPEVTVFIPANEAKSFFRALPPNGQVVLRL